jgi:hypothetical protein
MHGSLGGKRQQMFFEKNIAVKGKIAPRCYLIVAE